MGQVIDPNVQKVKFTLRDFIMLMVGLIVICVINTGTAIIYVERRFSGTETTNTLQDVMLKKHEEELAEIRATRTSQQAETNTKLDKINDTLSDVRVKIAEIATHPK